MIQFISGLGKGLKRFSVEIGNNSLDVSDHRIPFQENIVGGDFADVNEFKWAALLNLSSSENGETNRCGGSLISDRSLIFSPINQSNIQ